jgi:hypothetical protein
VPNSSSTRACANGVGSPSGGKTVPHAPELGFHLGDSPNPVVEADLDHVRKEDVNRNNGFQERAS